jgi:Fur family peroxide stress response transcriptional regulator
MEAVEAPEVEQRMVRFKEAAKNAGVKLTHQRLEVFRALASTREHPDAEALLRLVQARMPTISIDTIYRTLWTLNDLGLVSTLGPRRESVRFDANTDSHHHYVCVRCGLIADFESVDLADLSAPARVQGLGSVLATHLEITGICAGCQSQ